MQWWQKITLFAFVICLGLSAEAKDIQVTAMGAKPDGSTLNTAFIQKAIDACHDSGGGKVIFTPGTYLTGTIAFKDNVTLYLEKGAVIVGSTN
ncbi:MAG TPA: glycosyl hydrolase family 28-related protein, partial [Arachidicoccus sp.]|nr:glycosyl hydrolase family 28-related protein [Arachidicoccus sp.]